MAIEIGDWAHCGSNCSSCFFLRKTLRPLDRIQCHTGRFPGSPIIRLNTLHRPTRDPDETSKKSARIRMLPFAAKGSNVRIG